MTLKKYQAQGFVEALIAVAVAGIASVVLMSIAIDTLKQTVDNENEGKKTLQSGNVGIQLDYLVAAYNNGELPSPSIIETLINNPNGCFDPNIAMGDPTSTTMVLQCDYQLNGDRLTRDNCNLNDDSGEVFTYICTKQSTTRLLYVDIVSGLRGCDDKSCHDIVQSLIFPLVANP